MNSRITTYHGAIKRAGVSLTVLMSLLIAAIASGCASTKQFVPSPPTGNCPADKVQIHLHRPGPFMPQIGFSVSDKDISVGQLGSGGELLWQREPGRCYLHVATKDDNPGLNDSLTYIYDLEAGKRYDFELLYSMLSLDVDKAGMTIAQSGASNAITLTTKVLICPSIDQRMDKGIDLTKYSAKTGFTQLTERCYYPANLLNDRLKSMRYLDTAYADSGSYHGVDYETLQSGVVNAKIFATDRKYAVIPVIKRFDLKFRGLFFAHAEVEVFAINTLTGQVVWHDSGSEGWFIPLLDMIPFLRISDPYNEEMYYALHTALKKMPILEP